MPNLVHSRALSALLLVGVSLAGVTAAEWTVRELSVTPAHTELSDYEPPNDGKPDRMEGAGGRYLAPLDITVL
jgi:hypothetical protein